MPSFARVKIFKACGFDKSDNKSIVFCISGFFCCGMFVYTMMCGIKGEEDVVKLEYRRK